jgi:hypothetical protein
VDLRGDGARETQNGRPVNERFETAMKDPKVVHDTVVLGDFIQIWCDGHHGDRDRRPVETDGQALGIYGRKRPVLCEECAGHLAYAEKRRALCPYPSAEKPFCAHCETHCYRQAERDWQREMMRYSGPKSWRKGHAIDGIKHLLEGRAYRKRKQHEAAASSPAATSTTGTNHQEATR